MDQTVLDISELIRNDPRQLFAIYDHDPTLARQIADQWTAEAPDISARCLYVASQLIAYDNKMNSILRQLGGRALRTLDSSKPTIPSTEAPTRT